MLTFDTRDFQRAARRMDALANQIPFAAAMALNTSAEIARKEIAEEVWPAHVEARNRSFMRAALSTKGERATKRRLRVVVYDRLGRASLKLHDEGGSKRPRGKALAVPSADLQSRRSGKGVPKGMRPRNLPAAKGNPTNGAFVKGDVLYQRFGKGKGRGLKLRYVLKPSVSIRADVPFHTAFASSMRRSMPAQFRIALRRAMVTARKTK